MARLSGRLARRIAVAMIMISTPAYVDAQTTTTLGTHIPEAKPAEIQRRPSLSSEDSAEAVIIAFSQCVVAKNRKGVDHVLSLDPTSRTYAKAMGDLATDECLDNGSLRMNTLLMRGGLFAALYKTAFQQSSPVMATTPVDFVEDVPNLDSEDAREYVALRQFADCVVRDDPADSRSFILSGIGSQSQSSALAALSGHFSPCLAKSATFRFNKSSLYSFMAEALYRETARAGGAVRKQAAP